MSTKKNNIIADYTTVIVQTNNKSIIGTIVSYNEFFDMYKVRVVGTNNYTKVYHFDSEKIKQYFNPLKEISELTKL